MLRERIYGAVACLIALLILVRHDSPDFTLLAGAIALAVDACALWAASLFPTTCRPWWRRSSDPLEDDPRPAGLGEIPEAFALPILLLALVAWASCCSEQPSGPVSGSRTSLGAVPRLAARRLPVLNGQRAAVVLVLLALCAPVVAVKTLRLKRGNGRRR